METAAPPGLLPHLWKATLISGILALLLGVLVIVVPTTVLIVTVIFFVAYLLITGVAQVVLAISMNVPTSRRLLLFISGAAAVVLAVMCMFSLDNALTLLAIWIGIGFIFRGVATAAAAFSDPTLPGRWWEAFVGVISLLAGIVMLAAPLESLETLTTVVGIWFIVIGIVEIITSFGIRKTTASGTLG